MIFLISAILILTCAHFLSLRTDLRSPVDYVLGTFVYASANIVLTGLILGAFGLLANKWATIFLETLFLLIAYLIVRTGANKKGLATTGQPITRIINTVISMLKNSPDIILLFLSVFFSVMFALFLIWFLPPNSHDVLTTHLSRVGYWLQNGTYLPFPSHNLFDLIYPLNPALQAAWVMVVAGSDRMVEIFQWLAALVCALAVFGLSRVMGDDRKSAAFKGLLFLSFPIVIMQSTTAQTDLVLAAFGSIGFYFFLSGFLESHNGKLLVSALSIGLALGSKQLAFLLLPGFALATIILIKIKNGNGHRLLIQWGLMSAAAFFVFGSQVYIINLLQYGNPLGNREVVTASLMIDKTENPLDMLFTNSMRFVYGSLDPTGLPKPANIYLVRAKAKLSKPFLNALGVNLEKPQYCGVEHDFSYLAIPETTEDEAWFGVVGFVVLTGAAFSGFVSLWKRKNQLKFLLAGTAVIYCLLVVASRPGWDAYQGRYFIVAAALLLPALPLSNKKGFIHTLARSCLSALCVLIVFTTHLNNYSKPLVGKETVWQMNWMENITRQNRSYRPLLKGVRIHIPPNTHLGIIFTPGTWDYPLFTEEFTRTVTPIVPAEKVLDETWLRDQGIQYILINTPEDPWIELPKYLNYFYQVENVRFLRVRPPT